MPLSVSIRPPHLATLVSGNRLDQLRRGSQQLSSRGVTYELKASPLIFAAAYCNSPTLANPIMDGPCSVSSHSPFQPGPTRCKRIMGRAKAHYSKPLPACCRSLAIFCWLGRGASNSRLGYTASESALPKPSPSYSAFLLAAGCYTCSTQPRIVLSTRKTFIYKVR